MADKHDHIDIHRIDKDHNALVSSYLHVRRAVGLLGIILPTILILFAMTQAVDFMPSISEFYFTPVREALVATIGAIAVFLYAYKGYGPDPDRAREHPRERVLTDRRVSFAAATGALGVALFPVNSPFGTGIAPTPLAIDWMGVTASGGLHNASALLFFAALTLFCLDNFQRMPLTMQASSTRSAENSIYQSCGVILLLCTIGLIATGLINKFGPDALATTMNAAKTVFILEAIGLAAFSVSWLVKGKTLRPVVRGVEALKSDTK